MPFRRPVKEVNAEYPAEERFLDALQRVAREACAVAGLTRKQTSSVQLAIEEGATNIIRHAYLYDKGSIRLRIGIYQKRIIFSLIDTGRSFNPDGAERVDLDKLVESGRRGGLGFYMMQKVMDSVEYISFGGYNELRMTKRLTPEPARSASFLRRMGTLRIKFSFATFLVVASIVALTFWYVDNRTSSQIRDHLDETMRALSSSIAEQASTYMLNRRTDVEFDELIVSYTRSNPNLKSIVLTDSTSQIIANTEDPLLVHQRYEWPESVSPDEIETPQPLPGGDELYLVVPITQAGRQAGRVHVIYSGAIIEGQLREARIQVIVLTGVLLIVGVIGIYLLSSYFVTPIMKITERVRRFSRGDIESELPLEGAEEFFEISRALNDMVTRVSRDRQNAIERERLAREIELAGEIQQALMPQVLPDVPGLEIETYYRAASMVGGDLFDVFELPDNRYCLVVADVSGKGVPASLLMSILRTAIRIQSRLAPSPRETLVMVDEYIGTNVPKGMFVTVQLCFYDPATRQVSLVSAGHNPLLYYDAGREEMRSLNPPGMPLGVQETLKETFADRLEETTITIGDGDSFVLFTDGVTETANREGEQYGDKRLSEFLSARLKEKYDLKRLSEELSTSLDSFCGHERHKDDITFVMVRAGDGEKSPEHISETGEKGEVESKVVQIDRKAEDSH